MADDYEPTDEDRLEIERSDRWHELVLSLCHPAVKDCNPELKLRVMLDRLYSDREIRVRVNRLVGGRGRGRPPESWKYSHDELMTLASAFESFEGRDGEKLLTRVARFRKAEAGKFRTLPESDVRLLRLIQDARRFASHVQALEQQSTHK